MERRPLFNAALWLFLIAPMSIANSLWLATMAGYGGIYVGLIWMEGMVGAALITLLYLWNYGGKA